MTKTVELPAWQALGEHYNEVKDHSLRALFAADDKRFERFQTAGAGIFLDYSKNHLSEKTHQLLLSLATQSKLEQKIEAMFSGDIVNPTEGRPALHTALVMVNGEDVMPGIESVLTRLRIFSDKVREGDWRGFEGDQITNVVNIGIGGSDLGPLMASEALGAFASEHLTLHFVSNVDGSHLAEAVFGI